MRLGKTSLHGVCALIVLFVLAMLVASGPASAVDVAITADNAYKFGYGTSTGLTSVQANVENCSAADIFNCGPGPELYLSVPSPSGSYLYIIAYSDNETSEGVLGQFVSGSSTIYTGTAGWQVYATGIDFNPTQTCSGSGPSLATINAEITRANNNLGGSGSSVGWVGTNGGAPGSVGILAIGEPNDNAGGTFPQVCTAKIGADAHWMWYNPDPNTISNPFFGTVHGEFLIFRLPTMEVCGTCNDKLQDAFPFNEAIQPGLAAFDTTTAMMVTNRNIVEPAWEPGVVAGDTLVFNSPYTGDGVTTGTRVDLIFRIKPGPGNYVTKGNRATALINKDPGHPFFAVYRANNGPFGTPGGHGANWNADVWNSCRMDSAESNIYPILSRGIGNPVAPMWMGAIHESDAAFNVLGISHNICFLVDPAGPNTQSNITCDGTPPAVYGAVSGVTKEGTKIIPDGWLSPGSHVEYFIRRSFIENVGDALYVPDTTRVNRCETGTDLERWWNVDVLPDLWKDPRFGGSGLACMLIIDAADPRGEQPAFLRALDVRGFGAMNGASTGWKMSPNNLSLLADPDDPAGFVAANLGQMGLNFDWYDLGCAASDEGGHPGSRFANNPGAIALKRSTSGPSATMLSTYYSSVVWLQGDLDNSLHDGETIVGGVSRSSDDVTLLDGFLNGATPSNRRFLWLNGDDAAEELATILTDPSAASFLDSDMGSDVLAADYGTAPGNALSPMTFVPAVPGFSTFPWGLMNDPSRSYDVLAPAPASAASSVARYETTSDSRSQGGPGPNVASIYNPVGPGRDFGTVLDGFAFSQLRGGMNHSASDDNARFYWLDRVLSLGQVCAPRGPVIGVDDAPSSVRSGARIESVYPNPVTGRQATINFDLPRAGSVTIRLHDIAGRLVHEESVTGHAGRNSYTWNRSRSMRGTAPGVYFWELVGAESSRGSSAGRMVILGSLSTGVAP